VAPRGFVLDGTQYAALSWTELLGNVLREVAARHPDDSESVKNRNHGFASRVELLGAPNKL